MENKEYNSAILAGEQGAIHQWTLDFLEGSGANPSLARVLRVKGSFHIGPIEYPLDQLKPILGPDESFKFYEDQAVTDKRVAAMLQSYSEGWRPAPIIATDLWEEHLTVADGAHRHELFKKVGIQTYLTIFYFRDQTTLDAFKQKSGSRN